MTKLLTFLVNLVSL